MGRFIKICIYSIIGIILAVSILTIFTSLLRYEDLDISKKVDLIKEDNAIRGGETSDAVVFNDPDTVKNNQTEDVRQHIRLSDSKPLDTLQFLFASLALEDVDQFIFSFNVEVILLEFQTIDEKAKERIYDSMNKISRDNSIQRVKYNELKDNQMELKLTYEDGNEAEVVIDLNRTVSIHYESEPTFYNIITPVSDIIEQIENTIQVD